MYGYIKTPIEVLRISAGIRECANSSDETAVLDRLLNHNRMNVVWRQLLSEKRGGGYQHPAVGGAISVDGPVYAQQRACGQVLSGAFFAVCHPAQASKWREVEASRDKVLANAAAYRFVADKLAANGLVDPAADGGAAAALRLALVEEERAVRMLAQMRNRDDPLVIGKERGDRVARGVSTIIAIRLNELFGENLYGIAATLAEVGLGEKVGRQMVRSMISKA